MMRQIALIAFTLLTITNYISGCNDTKFRGGNGKKEQRTPENPENNPESPNRENPAVNCTEQNEVSGPNLVIVVDNSGSQAETDCPNRVQISHDRYECRGETYREKAVRASTEYLVREIDRYQKRVSAHLSLVSFPDGTWSGSKRELGWTSLDNGQVSRLGSALNFSRRPWGMTPYRDGLQNAADLLREAPNNGGKKIVVLVTDGEPTDRDPGELKRFAKETIRASSSELVTVLVKGSESDEARRAKHANFLRSHRYNQGQIDELLGLNGKSSVIDEISSQKIQVNQAQELEGVLKNLLVTKVNCK